MNSPVSMYKWSLIGGVIGVLDFGWIYGFEIVDPRNFAWMMESDASQYFLGWHFFRGEPWALPLGAIHTYGYPERTSLVYMDSLPLVAIPLKLFHALLPEVF